MATVSVDNDFARFGAKSYAINKINSVEVREVRPYKMGGAVFWGLAAALFLLGGLGSLASPQDSSAGFFVIAVVCAFLAYWFWQRAKIREYRLFLMTSSSEAQAFVSRDREEVLSLRDSIEAAMISHSRGGMAA